MTEVTLKDDRLLVERFPEKSSTTFFMSIELHDIEVAGRAHIVVHQVLFEKFVALLEKFGQVSLQEQRELVERRKKEQAELEEGWQRAAEEAVGALPLMPEASGGLTLPKNTVGLLSLSDIKSAEEL